MHFTPGAEVTVRFPVSTQGIRNVQDAISRVDADELDKDGIGIGIGIGIGTGIGIGIARATDDIVGLPPVDVRTKPTAPRPPSAAPA